jgi:PAS domain S-box-containing protein
VIKIKGNASVYKATSARVEASLSGLLNSLAPSAVTLSHGGGTSFLPDLPWRLTPADGLIAMGCLLMSGGLAYLTHFIRHRIIDRKIARKQIEPAHAQIMERQRLLFDAAFAIQWTNSPEGEMRGEQLSWGLYTGQSYETYQRYGWSEAIHPEDRQHTVRLWQQAVEKRSLFDCEHRVRRHDGVYRSFTVRGVPVLDAEGHVLEWVGVHSDIDDRKKAEEQRVQLLFRQKAEATLHAANAQLQLAIDELSQKSRQLVEANAHLHKSDELFRLLIDALQEGVVVADPQGEILHFNPMAEKMLELGATKGDVSQWSQTYGMYLNDGLTPCPSAQLPLARAIKGADVDAMELLHRSATQPEGILLSIVGRALRDANGSVVAGMAVMVDITERRRVETILREAKNAAEAANRSKSDFLANMSHEIRTPMNALIGMSDLLADTSLDAEQTKYLTICRSAGQQLLAVIDDILDFSKVEAGQLTLENIDFNLHTFLEATLEMVKERFEKKKIGLQRSLEEDLPQDVVGDPHRLRQIILNLLSNALKFTSAGGSVRLHVERLTEGLNTVQFCVQDTGVGIDPKKISIIFDSFAQADTSTTRKYGGTGLGLSISKRLTELMGGTIAVQSTLGKGSSFFFWVPLPPSQEPVSKAFRDHNKVIDSEPNEGAQPMTLIDGRKLSSAAQQSAQITVAKSYNILIAEDTEDNRFLIEIYLRSQPYRLVFATDGAAAVQKFTEQPIDLVLMDVQLPILDGYEATRRIRAWEQDQGLPRTPILALTANAFKGDAAQSLAGGCDAHLSKPIKKDVLLQEISKWLHPQCITVIVDKDLMGLIPEYMRHRQANVGELRTALKKEDFKALRAIGHILKGVGGSYGFSEITTIGIAIERAASERSCAQIAQQIDALQSYLTHVKTVFR